MRTVAEAMEPYVFWLPFDMPSAPRSRGAREGTDQWSVCARAGMVIGVISLTDLAENYGEAHELRLVRDVMTPEVFTVKEAAGLDEAMRSD